MFHRRRESQQTGKNKLKTFIDAKDRESAVLIGTAKLSHKPSYHLWPMNSQRGTATENKFIARFKTYLDRIEAKVNQGNQIDTGSLVDSVNEQVRCV